MRNFLLLLVVLSICGCSWISGAQVATPKPPVLAADKIYTVKAGMVIPELLEDGKQIGPVSFPFDMKLVAPNVLLEQEEKLNKALLAKVKSDGKNSTRMKIVSYIFGILASICGVWAVNVARQKFFK